MSARDVLANTTWEDGERVGTYAANLILTALTAAGYAVVPREPTQEMTLAANKRVAVVTLDGTWALTRDEAARTWAAMLAAGEATP